MTTYNSVNVVCPFYKSDKENEIWCESPVSAKLNKTVFLNKEEKNRHMNEFCNSMKRYENCPLSVINGAKYRG